MDAKRGVDGFLVFPFQQGLLTKDDLEKAIEIASEKSPSAAIHAGYLAYSIAHPDSRSVWAGENFGKGVRWLSIIRRDEGQEAFDKACAELRQFVSTPTP